MPPSELVRALETVVAITVTPFDPAGAIDTDTYAKVVARLVENGIRVVTPNGNTSEFYALTPAELQQSLEVTVSAVDGRALVVAGVGHELPRAIEMTKAAALAGASAVMVHQPVHPYQSAAGWVAYHRAIAEAVPQVGVVCYVRNPVVTAAELSSLAEVCPNVVGVKYAVPDVVGFAELVGAVGERLACLCGLAETWAPFFWTAGARGFTSGLANVAPQAALDLFERLRAGDADGAMALWRTLKPFEDMRARDGNAANVAVVKEALAQLGLCARSVRPPSSELSSAAREEVSALLPSLTATR
jgi:4-hydroxy-tetrahydrodipicolinate synthase